MSLSKITVGAILMVAIATSLMAQPKIEELSSTRAGKLGICTAFISFKMKRNETLTNGQQAFLDREIDTINRYEAAKKREHPSCPSDNNQVYLACMSKRLTPDEYAYYFMYIVRDYVGQNDPGYANRGGFECYKEFE